jgi:hypothetical protein
MLKRAVTITWLPAQFSYIQNLATGQLDYQLPKLTSNWETVINTTKVYYIASDGW